MKLGKRSGSAVVLAFVVAASLLSSRPKNEGEWWFNYLDKVEAAPASPPSAGGDDSDPDEAAWRTAVDAAPYLLDEEEAGGDITPEKAFEKLKPFKDLVADDIRSGPHAPPDDE